MDHEPPEGAAVVAGSEKPMPCARGGRAAPEVLCSCAGRNRQLPVACLASVPYDSQTNTACMPQSTAYQLVDPLLESMAAQSALADLEGCVAYHALNSPP